MKSGWTKMFGGLVPADPDSEAWLSATKQGQFVEIDITRPRNYHFHKKYFALLNYAFANWDVPEGDAEKNWERFRDDLTIMAGYYIKVWNVSGELRLVPKSISFANMGEQEFQGLYSKTLDVILAKILKTHTQEDVDKIINTLLGFM